MAIEIQLFAAAAETAGRRRITLQVPAGTCVADLAGLIGIHIPQLKELANHSRWAVGTQFAPPDRQLTAGETVAMIPPVSGG